MIGDARVFTIQQNSISLWLKTFLKGSTIRIFQLIKCLFINEEMAGMTLGYVDGFSIICQCQYSLMET